VVIYVFIPAAPDWQDPDSLILQWTEDAGRQYCVVAAHGTNQSSAVGLGPYLDSVAISVVVTATQLLRLDIARVNCRTFTYIQNHNCLKTPIDTVNEF